MTNKSGSRKFRGIFENNPDIEWFDALVGFLRASGYFAVRPHFEKVPHIRILAGINIGAIMAAPVHAPNAFQKEMAAAHEPVELPPGFGGWQPSGVLPQAGSKVREQKRQRTAAVHDAGATSCTLLGFRGALRER